MIARLLLPICLFLLFAATARAAPPAAGTLITNTATATFTDSASGQSVRLTSNTVETRVAELEALTLVSSQSLVIATGGSFSLSHTLTNTGNTSAAYLVNANVVSGSGFTPLNVQVVQDSNSNGRSDAGEPVIPAGSTITVAAGASVGLLITGQAPGGAVPGQTAQIRLTATSRLQGATASNTDTLSLTNGAALQVSLSASVATAMPSAPVSFTATTVNNGNVSAGPASVIVNGAAASLFILRVSVPNNTGFASAQPVTNVNAQLLYHLAGSPANAYVTAVPAGGVVDAVAWSLPVLPEGGSLQGQFSVLVNGNAAGTISTSAFADWTETGSSRTTAGNTVLLPLPARSASISFYNPGFNTPATQGRPGKPLFVQVDAAPCNLDPSQVGTVPVTITSQLTGDVESFTAVETGPNTGLFRILPDVPTADATTRVVAAGDGVLETLRNDTITATITSCGGITVSATTTLLIDPSGIVYDSKTNQPVAGATVQLIDVTGAGNGGNPSGPAIVFQEDGSTPAPSVIVTGVDGSYAFPFVSPSTYRLMVTTPAGYVFPSKLPPALQPTGRIVDASGSYSGNFIIGGGVPAPVRFDLPLDTGGSAGLFIQKTANKTTAEIGDFVDYSVKFNNVVNTTLNNTLLNDVLPPGFAYVRGTARLNGAPVADPAGGAGPSLQFSIGSVAAASQPVVSYRVRIGAGSRPGMAINTAQATSGTVQSNRSTAKVQVVGGVFSSKAYVIGKVFADCNRDGVQEAGEAGIPGVRIYLEEGTYAITDEEGKYSFYGLEPRTHVAKVDNTTLPAGATLQVISNRNAMDAGSQFVDLTKGELRKADFAVAGCSPDLREQIAARRKALANPSEILQAAASLLSATGTATATDARTLPSAGVLGLPGALNPNGSARNSTLPIVSVPMASSAAALGAVGDPGGPFAPRAQGITQPIFTPTAAPQATPAPAESDLDDAERVTAAEPLENLLLDLNNEVGFIGLRHEQIMAGDQTWVRVKGPLGGMFELTVNGQVVPATEVGKKSALEKNALLAWEYIGVNLKPGRNTLFVRAADGFGNARGTAGITLIAPGALAKVEISASPEAVADGATALPVIISLRDAAGVPVAARNQITLQASLGRWQTADLDPRQPGVQVFVQGGEGRFLLVPPAQPGKAEITAASGTIKSSVAVEFMPNLRPMIAAGIVEGTINLRNLGSSSLQSASSGDVFERQIQTTTRSFNNGKASAAARTALFLKGKVLGSTLLTLSYDSDKPSDTKLFRDIQPNQFYPVYGDSSARGFDAQSTGKLYVLLQNGTNYALLGDYSTQSDNPARLLTQYSRALNGAKGRWQEGAVTVDAFASRTSSTQVVQEFRANGTSGPFRLDVNGVVNSQQVDVITRNRNQPSVIVKDTALSQFTDYEIEAYSGTLLLKSPVPSVDADLNPVYIRVSYSVDAGGAKHTVAGIDARAEVLPGVTVGANVVRDDDPLNKQNLNGLNVTAQLAEKTVATAEIARSSTDAQGSGSGQRVEIRHEGRDLQARAWGVRTDGAFYNPSSLQSAGQSEYGAKIGYTLNETNRVVGEALRTSSSVTGAAQTGAELKLEHSLPGNIKIEAGVRYSSANATASLSGPALPGTSMPIVPAPVALAKAPTEEVATTSARVKVTVPVPGVPEADVYGLLEYAIDGSDGRELGIGGNYAINPSSRAYVRHDFINSLKSAYTLNQSVSQYTTVVGINTDLTENTQLFNEYRLGDSINGRGGEASLGLRQLFRLGNGIGLTASLQRIKPISGVVLDDSTAVTLGADYTAAADWKVSGQVQWQSSTTSRSWLLSGAMANKLDASWTLLNRALYSQQTNPGAGGGEREIINAQSGFAYRPVETDVWNALGRVEFKRDADTTLSPRLKRDESGLILSTHLNVQPNRSWMVSGRYAAKWARDSSNGLNSRSFTQLLGARSTSNLTDRWDVSLQAYRMWGNGAAETAAGVEVGYMAYKNTWVSVGYNLKGFRAPDLTGEAYTQRGLYARLRFKFDENLFDGGAAVASAALVAAKP